MPFPSALDATAYTRLRGDSSTPAKYAATQLLCLWPNTVIFAARVNGAPTGTSFAQVAFDTVTTGAYTDIQVGQTVYIGADSNIRNADFVGRVRKTPTSSILYINETSASIPDNAYIFVTNDVRIWDKLAREVGTTQYKDYDLAFSQLKPVVYGLQSVYAGVCSGSPAGFTVAFAASALATTSGASISSYAYTIPSGGTVTAGATNTANVTVRFDAGTYLVKLVVTDSGGRATTFFMYVFSIPADFSSVVSTGFAGATVNSNESGYSASVNAFTGISSVLDQTLAVILNVEYYNGSAVSIVSNIEFVGRIRTETDHTYADPDASLIQEASYQIEGIEAQLSRVEHLPFTLITKASPAVWDEIKTLTIWRALVYTLQEHTTLLNLHSLSFDSTADTFAYPALPTQGGNILAVIEDIAVSINAVFQSSPAGECQIVRQADYLSTAQRNALITVANFTTADLLDYNLQLEEAPTTGKVQASGGFYTSISDTVTPLLSLAPGMAQDVGENIINLTRQVLAANVSQATAQAELNTRAGNHYAINRQTNPTLNVTFPAGYRWLIPAANQWYTFTISANDNLGGRAYTTADRWLCISVDVTHDNLTGGKSVQASFQLEAQGVAGQTVAYPTVGTNPTLPVLPPLPPFPAFPPLPDIFLPPTPGIGDAPPYTPPTPISNGNIAVIWSASAVWITRNLLTTSSPMWTEITPQDGLIYTAAAWVGNGARGLYALANDGTDSVFFYTTDPFTTPTWVSTTLSAAIYETIRVSSTTGAVYIEGVTNVVTPGSCDLSTWSVRVGTEVSRTSSQIVIDSALVSGSKAIEIKSSGEDACCIIDSISQTGMGSPVYQWNLCGESYSGDFPSDDLAHTGLFPSAHCINAFLAFGFLGGDIGRVTINFSADEGCGDAITSSTMNIAYSTDFGAMFSAPESPSGSLVDDVGFDIEKIGIPTLVGIVGKVKEATTAGGSYSDYGSAVPTDSAPNCIVIPRYQFGSTTGANSGTTPQYLLGSGAESDIGKTMWKVTSSGGTFTSITPSIGGNPGKALGPNSLTMPFKFGNRISAVLMFDDEVHLVNSITSGTSWTDRGQIADDASYVRYRRGDTSGRQLFIANGSDGVLTSGDHGNTLNPKTVPTDDAILGIEPL